MCHRWDKTTNSMPVVMSSWFDILHAPSTIYVFHTYVLYLNMYCPFFRLWINLKISKEQLFSFIRNRCIYYYYYMYSIATYSLYIATVTLEGIGLCRDAINWWKDKIDSASWNREMFGSTTASYVYQSHSVCGVQSSQQCNSYIWIINDSIHDIPSNFNKD